MNADLDKESAAPRCVEQDAQLADSPRAAPTFSTRQIIAHVVSTVFECSFVILYVVAFPGFISFFIFVTASVTLPIAGIQAFRIVPLLLAAVSYFGLMVLMIYIEGRITVGVRVGRALERLILGNKSS